MGDEVAEDEKMAEDCEQPKERIMLIFVQSIEIKQSTG